MFTHLDNSFGGMPGVLPKPEPIITFKDIGVGLEAIAIKSRAPVPKGMKVTVESINGDVVTIHSPIGNRTLSKTELCLYFNKQK